MSGDRFNAEIFKEVILDKKIEEAYRKHIDLPVEVDDVLDYDQHSWMDFKAGYLAAMEDLKIKIAFYEEVWGDDMSGVYHEGV